MSVVRPKIRPETGRLCSDRFTAIRQSSYVLEFGFPCCINVFAFSVHFCCVLQASRKCFWTEAPSGNLENRCPSAQRARPVVSLTVPSSPLQAPRPFGGCSFCRECLGVCLNMTWVKFSSSQEVRKEDFKNRLLILSIFAMDQR